MSLHVSVKDCSEIELREPAAARLFVELARAVGHALPTAAATEETLPTDAVSRLNEDAPLDIVRFRVFCLQRTAYGGKVAAHLDFEALAEVRSFIHRAADTRKDVVVLFA